MSCTVTPSDVYAELECYGISSANVSEAWIERRLDYFIKKWVEGKTRLPLDGSKQYTDEYYSGNGSSTLILRRRFVSSIERAQFVNGNNIIGQIDVGSIVIVSREGILKSRASFDEVSVQPLFPRGKYNIVFDYTVTLPTDVNDSMCEAVKYLLCEQVLGHLAGRTGGGNVSVQGYNRDSGKRGRWSNERNDFARMAHALLSPYFGIVTGS